MTGSNVLTTIHNGWAALDKFILRSQDLKHLRSSTTADTIYLWISALHCMLGLHNIKKESLQSVEIGDDLIQLQ
jgi:hypothetical protein